MTTLAERVSILMVDDRPDGLLTMDAVLKNPEYKLVAANSGLEALAHLEEEEFAVILLDVQMPGMDGFQTAAKIKENPRTRNIPILFITAIHKDPFYIYQGYTAGAVDYIFKPFDPAILRSKVAVFVSLFRQQNDLKRQAEELHKKEQELHQSQKLEAVGRLAGGVAHDFNNLITGILGISHDVWSTLDPKDPRRDDLEEVIKASSRALSLTKQLLAFGRRQIISPRIINLNIVVTDMMKMLRRLIIEDIELITSLAPSIAPIKMDQGQMEQVIMNLVLNARDAIAHGGKIFLTTYLLEIKDGEAPPGTRLSSGRHVVLEISDTGSGMDLQTLNHIFEPYYSTKQKDKGTGLGLATVYGIVMQGGGDITVRSTPSSGTMFKIYFPETQEQINETPQEPSLNATAEGGQETILLVEDEPIVRQVVVRALRKGGYTVLEAGNGKEALDLASRHSGPIELLITDVVMPGMNGRQLAELLVERRPDTAILYMSGYSEDIVMHRGSLEPGIAFIEKSFTSPLLLTKVREVIDARAARRQDLKVLPS